MNAGTLSPSQLFFDKGEQPKVTWSQIVIVGRMNQNLDVSLLKKGHSDLGFVGFAQVWGPFFFFFFSGTFDDITFLITSNNHMADDVNAILIMVIG